MISKYDLTFSGVIWIYYTNRPVLFASCEPYHFLRLAFHSFPPANLSQHPFLPSSVLWLVPCPLASTMPSGQYHALWQGKDVMMGRKP